MTTTLEAVQTSHPTASRGQWLAARKALLEKEKQYTHLRDELARLRQALPWVKVEKTYQFDSPCGTCGLPDLFGDKSQLLVYHFMFGPDWAEGCPSCSLIADHLAGIAPHLSQRDVSLVLVSRASVEKIAKFKQRMGWKLHWVSSGRTDFNQDFKVSFTDAQMAAGKVYNFETTAFPVAEAPGMSAFARQSEQVYHTYSTYGRGCEELLGIYNLLDIAPRGRDEANLPFPMAWVRHHDRYSQDEPSSGLAKPACGCS